MKWMLATGFLALYLAVGCSLPTEPTESDVAEAEGSYLGCM